MNSRLKSLLAGAFFAASTLLVGVAQAQTPNPLRVGVRGGSDELIWEAVAQEAKKANLNVEVVVIAGAVSPNEALNNGDLEANSFQHIPFLRDQIKQRGYKLAIVGETYISPVAIYTKKAYKSLADLPEGAKVGIPSDPSNQTRALVILRDAGLITLTEGFDPFKGTASLNDVTGNPKKLKLLEAAHAVLARSLEDLDVAAVINSFAFEAGLIATRDGIAVEKKENNPYVNILVVREQNKDAPWARDLLKAYQSEAVRKFIREKFEGSITPAF
ncbi:metal ABC transporter substrate-binding protein [Betaproteobacteria bacterium]|nr:metal ABC transporter substrate-binding protein [Betaproteobacteria bacterium]GHU17312.1 metal ABC transporter substrate-binding protein [Betaproteobacteria bacterium]